MESYSIFFNCVKTFRIAFFLFLFISLSGYSAHAQATQIPSNIDFATVNVDEIPDQQLVQLVQKAQGAGYSVEDILQQAQAKGMSADNIAKLRSRLSNLNTQNNQTSSPSQDGTVARNYNGVHLSAKDSLALLEQARKQAYRQRIFGSDLFSNVNLTFEPNLNIPTPAGYVLGAGDELVVDVYGYSEKNDKLKVTPDGFVNIPNVGPVFVSGMTMEEAKNRIINRLSSIYSGIKSGSTHVQVLLGDIRSIRVMLIGEVVRPGSYTLPSLATITNALYVSGGPGESGSFRNITVVRNGKVIDTFDLYDFLINGDLKGNILLQDQDIVKVNPYKTRIILEGQVKHPAIFEAKENETLQDLITYAGGYTEKAYTGTIKATRITDKEKEVQTIPQSAVKGYMLQSGDSLYVDSVLNRFANRVSISGPVFFPGSYAVQPGMTVKDVIAQADGVKEDIFLNRGLIKRLKPDFSPEMIDFNVGEILSGTTAIPVQAEDSITLYSKLDIRERYYVLIRGEINKQDTLPYSEGMRVEDAILMAGGFKDAASTKEIEVARRTRSQEYDPKNLSMALVQKFTVSSDLDKITDSSNFILEPFDQITVRRSPGYIEQASVMIEGEVVYPGQYVIDSKSEKLSDLIRIAGGLKLNAFPEGALLLRKKSLDLSDNYLEQNKLAAFKEANKGDDSLELDKLKNSRGVDMQLVGINMEKALASPGSKYDLLLQKDDIIRVPQRLETVTLNGEVFYPKQVRFDKKYRFKDFISQGGGFTAVALRRRSYVVYPNGEVASTSKVLFFNHFPKVKPGSDIFVPAKRKREATSAGEILGLTTGLAALMGIIITIIQISK